MNLLKSLLHNIGVVLVGLAVAYIGTRLDSLLRVRDFRSLSATVAGCLLLSLGFFLRWATHAFYEHQMRVISLSPQAVLITSGPYRFTRNPLYLGGNVFIFFGAASLLGSPSAVVLTAFHLPLVDLMIRREEGQLEITFGEQWLRYKRHVRRWL
ncbi:MAG TPA: isoprenylcysteine carboxylmethyltransferase family protein [Candidatus Sulfotelmatobacter sp.]|nr:isoprenylcysteine carboxylmethyltransferase family protein [Candidatus Sulfotelmatobacter sp.]